MNTYPINEIPNGTKSTELTLDSFLLVVKENNKEAQYTAEKIQQWLREINKKSTIVNAFVDEFKLQNLAYQHDIVLVLGGDGTILGISRRLYKIPIPILGINFGKVGFLAEISPENWREALTNLFNGKYQIQNYTPLHFEHIRDNKIIHSGIAINDVVIARGFVARAIYISLSIDNIFLSDLHCDGLICSAPLGATAYAASSHGPLAFPSLDAHILTPISPFAGAFPPLVMPRESIIQIKVLDNRETAITIDGQDAYHAELNDLLNVKSANHKISMLVSDPHWFWKRLGDRGFIMPGPGKYTR